MSLRIPCDLSCNTRGQKPLVIYLHSKVISNRLLTLFVLHLMKYIVSYGYIFVYVYLQILSEVSRCAVNYAEAPVTHLDNQRRNSARRSYQNSAAHQPLNIIFSTLYSNNIYICKYVFCNSHHEIEE